MCILIAATVMTPATTRRVHPDLPDIPRNACRKLFATEVLDCIDPAVECGRALEEMRNEARDRWNFDFQREVPLPGRYEWVPVGAKFRHGSTSSSSASSDDPEAAATDSSSSASSASWENENCPPTTKKATSQSLITDFLRVHKRNRASLPVSIKKIKRRRNRNRACKLAKPSTT